MSRFEAMAARRGLPPHDATGVADKLICREDVNPAAEKEGSSLSNRCCSDSEQRNGRWPSS
jgi:hypothetical protein